MKISFHIGAHFTDDQKFLRSILKNKETLLEQGIIVPGPSKYRDVLNSAYHKINQGLTPAEIREEILERVLEGQDANRIILSTAAVLSGPKWIFKTGELYGEAAARAKAYADIFEHDEVSVFMGISNLANFVPAAFRESSQADFKKYVSTLQLRGDSWTQVISRVRTAMGHASITVWCNEDTPLLWSQLIREASGIDPSSVITGGFDLINEIMSHEGMERLLTYLQQKPPTNEAQKRRVLVAFLHKYAREDLIVEEMDLPGWDDHTIEQLTLAYEEDVALIEDIPDVRFISP